MAWSDQREGAARIYYVRSIDGGKTWSTPSGQRLDTATVPSDFHHVMPQMVVDHLGVFGCVYYELERKLTEKYHFPIYFDRGRPSDATC